MSPRQFNLRRAWDRTRTVPGLGRDVIALLVLVALGTTACGFVLVKQRFDWPWEDRFVISANFQEVPGISPGNGQEVRIAGVIVGTIKEAKVTSNGQARLKLSIEPGHVLYKDARVLLRAKTPLNDMYVEMSEGTPEAGKLRDGDVIPVSQTVSPVQVDRVLQNLDEDARSGLAAILQDSDIALANAPAQLGPGLVATDKTLDRFKPVMTALQTRREKLAELVTSISQIAGAAGGDEARIARLTNSLSSTLGTVSARDQELEQALAQMPGFVAQLRNATGSVTDLSKQLDPTLTSLRDASGVLPKAFKDVSGLAHQLQGVAEVGAPAAREARPVVADLRPVIPQLGSALGDISNITARLDPATRTVVSYLEDIRAFVYNTTSIFSVEDANGGILRGQAGLGPSSLPISTRGGNR